MDNDTTNTTVLAPIEVHQTPADFLAGSRYLARLSPQGVIGMRSTLKLATRLLGFADIDDVPWNHLNASIVQQLIVMASNHPMERGGRRSPASVRMLLNSVKGACKAAWIAETLSTDAWERIRDVKPPGGSRLPAGRNIGKVEKLELMRGVAGDARFIGARDAAILAVFMGTGLRVSEICHLVFEDLNLTNGKLVFIGKGDKQREAWIKGGAMDALLDWLVCRGRGEGPLFCPIAKGGHIKHDRHLTTTAVTNIVNDRATAAGIAHISPHDFRRTYAGDQMDAGVDLPTVSALMGHADPKTTMRYDRRGERTKEAAAGMVEVPYKRRGPIRQNSLL